MNPLKMLIASAILGVAINAADIIKPYKELKADDSVNDIVVSGDRLIAGTDGGSLIEFNLKDFTSTVIVHLPKITDFMGDKIDDKIFSVDFIDGTYLINADSGEGGFSRLYIVQDGKLTILIGPDKRLAIIKAKFLDKEHIFFVDLGSTIYLYDIKNRKIVYSKSISESKFSDFALNSDKTRAVIADESGILKVVDVVSGNLIKEIKRQHLDNVFSVAFSKNWITGGGQDRRASYYNLSNGEHGYFKSTFLVYATAISPDEKYLLYAMDPDNSMRIYDSSSLSEKYILKGQKSILTAVRFKDSDTIFSASHDDTIMMWKLNK